jgi:hypothetical protein
MRSPVRWEGRFKRGLGDAGDRNFFDPADPPWTAIHEFRLDADADFYRLRVVDGRLVELARGYLEG